METIVRIPTPLRTLTAGADEVTGNGTTLAEVIDNYKHNFIPHADANNLILQMRTWEKHDVGTTPGFNGDVEKALASIKAPILYMPSEKTR